jgi:hypothetical protein
MAEILHQIPRFIYKKAWWYKMAELSEGQTQANGTEHWFRSGPFWKLPLERSLITLTGNTCVVKSWGNCLSIKKKKKFSIFTTDIELWMQYRLAWSAVKLLEEILADYLYEVWSQSFNKIQGWILSECIAFMYGNVWMKQIIFINVFLIKTNKQKETK